jgi:hypothetical protein
LFHYLLILLISSFTLKIAKYKIKKSGENTHVVELSKKGVLTGTVTHPYSSYGTSSMAVFSSDCFGRGEPFQYCFLLAFKYRQGSFKQLLNKHSYQNCFGQSVCKNQQW